MYLLFIVQKLYYTVYKVLLYNKDIKQYIQNFFNLSV